MIRKAGMQDVKAIQKLVAEYAKKGDMLPRSLSEIYENLRDYFVSVEDGGEVVGSAAVHLVWEDLAEVRTVAVDPQCRAHHSSSCGAVVHHLKIRVIRHFLQTL